MSSVVFCSWILVNSVQAFRMSGYGPFGFSQTLAYVTYAFKSKTSSKTGDNGQIAARAVYVLLRFLLAVDTSLVRSCVMYSCGVLGAEAIVPAQIFELMGAFILTQVGYDGFDFKTHKKAEAIVVGTRQRPFDRAG